MNGIIVYASFATNILILIISCVCFIKIMKNDLVHVQKSLDEIKKNVQHLFKKVVGLCERVSKIEGKLDK